VRTRVGSEGDGARPKARPVAQLTQYTSVDTAPSGHTYRGSVRVRVTGASSVDAVSILALVQTPVGARWQDGKVGVAFGSVPAAAALDGPSLVPWPREGDGDRSNLAVLHAGDPEEGP